jgi:hypothetical protein
MHVVEPKGIRKLLDYGLNDMAPIRPKENWLPGIPLVPHVLASNAIVLQIVALGILSNPLLFDQGITEGETRSGASPCPNDELKSLLFLNFGLSVR